MKYIALSILLLIAGCSQEATVSQTVTPAVLTEDAIGHLCQMQAISHAGPKAQIHIAGEAEPLWFVQVRDALAFQRMPEQVGEFTAFFVSDMGAENATWQSPGTANWIAASDALYVIGSKARGGMGAPEIVPFSKTAAAEKFVSENGGEIVRFEELDNEVILAPVEVELEAPPDGGGS